MGPHLSVGTNLLQLPERDCLPLQPCFFWVTQGTGFVSLEPQVYKCFHFQGPCLFSMQYSHTWLTGLPLLEGHHLFGSGTVVGKELMGCLFIQYKCPPDIVKYLEISCWCSIPPPLKEVLCYVFASNMHYFLSSLDIETRKKGPGRKKQLPANK